MTAQTDSKTDQRPDVPMKPPRHTGPRMKCMTALKMTIGNDLGLTAYQIAKVAGIGGQKPDVRVRECLNPLPAHGLVTITKKGRSYHYRITRRGLLWMGSFPAAGEGTQ